MYQNKLFPTEYALAFLHPMSSIALSVAHAWLSFSMIWLLIVEMLNTKESWWRFYDVNVVEGPECTINQVRKSSSTANSATQRYLISNIVQITSMFISHHVNCQHEIVSRLLLSTDGWLLNAAEVCQHPMPQSMHL